MTRRRCWRDQDKTKKDGGRSPPASARASRDRRPCPNCPSSTTGQAQGSKVHRAERELRNRLRRNRQWTLAAFARRAHSPSAPRLAHSRTAVSSPAAAIGENRLICTIRVEGSD